MPGKSGHQYASGRQTSVPRRPHAAHSAPRWIQERRTGDERRLSEASAAVLATPLGSAPANTFRDSHILCGSGYFLCATLRAQRSTSGRRHRGRASTRGHRYRPTCYRYHGHTDVGMAVSHGTGFDMCPRLKALKDRHLFLPRGCEVPEILKPICEASLDFSQVPK